jgi:hypothetical protein
MDYTAAALSAVALNDYYRVYPQIVFASHPTQSDVLDVQKRYEHLTLLDRAASLARELLEVVEVLRTGV